MRQTKKAFEIFWKHARKKIIKLRYRNDQEICKTLTTMEKIAECRYVVGRGRGRPRPGWRGPKASRRPNQLRGEKKVTKIDDFTQGNITQKTVKKLKHKNGLFICPPPCLAAPTVHGMSGRSAHGGPFGTSLENKRLIGKANRYSCED